MNITEANAVNNLLRHFLNAPREVTGDVAPDQARESARTLVEKAYKAISAGLTLRDFDKLWPEGQSAALPPSHQAVIDHCVREAWTNLEAGDAHSEANVAADIAQRLNRVYGVQVYDDNMTPEATPEVLIVDGVLTCPKCGKQDIREVDACERWNPAELVNEGVTMPGDRLTEGPYIAVNLNDSHFEHDGWGCMDCQTRLTVSEPLDENVSYG